MSACQLYCELDPPGDGGDGLGASAVLLGGSLGTTLEMWEPQVQALAPRHRPARFDHRGHGRSPVPDGPYSIAELGNDVLALIDRLELDRVCYCGLSIGGMVGIWLAAHAPERIERLVLICTSARVPPEAGYGERAGLVRSEGIAAVAEAVLSRWFTPTYASEHPETVDRMRAMLLATPVEGYAGCCEAIAELDLRAELREITAPTLVIAGAEDEALPPAHSVAIAEAIPGARLELLDPAAHLASVERADAVSALIVHHLEPTEAT